MTLQRACNGVGLILLLGVSCRADLTLRYTTEVKLGSSLPPAVVTAMKQQMDASIPKERVVRIKGDKTSSAIGTLTAIIDSASAQMTLLNPVTKQYARLSMDDYLAGLRSNFPTMPAAVQQMMQGMKFDVHNTATGQVGMISGIRAEEHLTTLTISMDLPGVAAAGPLMRMEIHTWLASPDDLSRIPALRQYVASVERALSVSNPADAIQRVLIQIPGLGDKFREAMEELTKNAGSLALKTLETVYSPLMPVLAQGQADPNAPVLDLRMELTTISSDAIDDSVFEVPPDYQTASVAELIKALMPATAATPKASAPGEPIYKVGGGVSAPALLSRRDPVYSKEALQAKLEGTVTLSIVVDKEGSPTNMHVVRSLGLGLDEKAMEAVSQWKFRPGQRDGQPVNVVATIQVNFKLLDRPLQQ